MFERLSDKKIIPVNEELLLHMGETRKFFEIIDEYLKNDLNAEEKVYFDVHDKGWAVGFRSKKDKYICNIVAEKDAFLFVTGLSAEKLEEFYENCTEYAKKCIENSPYRHSGWIEYRVIDEKSLDEAKVILQNRLNHIESLTNKRKK